MKSLTVHQPYAWAIVAGVKRLENRSWPTSYRGPVAIHAGKSTLTAGDDGEWDREVMTGMPHVGSLPYGAFIGTAVLIDCLPVEEAERRYPDQYDFASGPWCWVFADPLPLPKPIAANGMLGLFTAPSHIERPGK